MTDSIRAAGTDQGGSPAAGQTPPRLRRTPIRGQQTVAKTIDWYAPRPTTRDVSA